MVFNSLTFLVFFAIVLALHRTPFSWTAKKSNLLVASYVFHTARFTRAYVGVLRERYVRLRTPPVLEPAG